MNTWNEWEGYPEGAFQPRPGGGMRLFKKDAAQAQAPDPEYIAAAIKSMGVQDDVIQRVIGISEEMLPLQQEATREGLNIAKLQAQGQLGMAGAAATAAQTGASAAYQQALTANKLADSAIGLNDYQLEQMRRNDARYWDVGVKQEDQLIADVAERSSDKYKERQAGMAAADVQTGFDSAIEQAQRDQAAMGIDPSSPAAQLGMSRMIAAKGLGMADSKNKTRIALDQTDMANKFQLYGGLKGMAGLGQTSAQLATGAINAGTGAVNAGTNAVMAGSRGGGGGGGGNVDPTAGIRVANMGLDGMTSGFARAGTLAGGMGNTATGMYNAQANFNLGNAKLANQDDGLMGALGSVAGAAASKGMLFGLSDKNTKKKVRRFNTKDALDAVVKTPVSKWQYKKGQGDEGEHIGPMAQDVNRTMGEGAAPGGRMVDLISMNGVTMAAVQELDKKVSRALAAGKLGRVRRA